MDDLIFTGEASISSIPTPPLHPHPHPHSPPTHKNSWMLGGWILLAAVCLWFLPDPWWTQNPHEQRRRCPAHSTVAGGWRLRGCPRSSPASILPHPLPPSATGTDRCVTQGGKRVPLPARTFTTNRRIKIYIFPHSRSV